MDQLFTKAELEKQKLKTEAKEIAEAIDAGNSVKSAVSHALEKLSKAEDWATFDMFSRGGIINHMMKYENIDEAQDTIKRIGYLVDKFKAELGDVGIYDDSVITSANSSRFVDFFFDNIFTDMHIKDQIKTDMNSLYNLQSKITNTIDSLIARKSAIEKQLSEF